MAATGGLRAVGAAVETRGIFSRQQRVSQKDSECSSLLNQMMPMLSYRGCCKSGVQTQRVIRNRLSDHQLYDQPSIGDEQAAVASHRKRGLTCLLQNCSNRRLNASSLAIFQPFSHPEAPTIIVVLWLHLHSLVSYYSFTVSCNHGEFIFHAVRTVHGTIL